MTKNFPILEKEINIQVQEVQRGLHKKKPKGLISKHIIKMPKLKEKERILKAARE